MSARDALPVLALAATCVAIAAGAGWIRAARRATPDTDSVRLPETGLVLALASPHLGETLGSGLSPFWDAAFRPAERAQPSEAKAPGALALYRRGWILVTPGRDGWLASASPSTLLPAAGAPEIALPLPRDRVTLHWQRLKSSWGGALPSRADGVIGIGARRESWTLTCEAPCLLDALRADADAVAAPAMWSVLPAQPSAVVAMVFDPKRLEQALDVAMIDDVERFLGFALRRELSLALAGRGVVALTEPSDSVRESIIAVFDLARPDLARSLVERTLALGVLSGELGVERYRDVMVGALTRSGDSLGLRPAIAVDGDLLLVANRKSDLLAALDRRRLSATSGPPRSLLDRSGPGPWRGFSRSAFLTNSWLELLTGRLAPPEVAAGEVSARLVRHRDRWVLESEGQGPAFAAEPILPAMRALVRETRAAR